jgi:ethanolamine ammonia-lyase small subunit
MDKDELISLIVSEVMRQLETEGKIPDEGCDEPALPDITSPECRAQTLIEEPIDSGALRQMKQRTTARIGIGRAGPRLKTQTLLTLRADQMPEMLCLPTCRPSFWKNWDCSPCRQCARVKIHT